MTRILPVTAALGVFGYFRTACSAGDLLTGFGKRASGPRMILVLAGRPPRFRNSIVANCDPRWLQLSDPSLCITTLAVRRPRSLQPSLVWWP